jgi:hypothetical protein
MDPQRMKAAYQQLEALEDRLAYKIRPRPTNISPSVDQVDAKLKDLANFTLELKDVLRELMLSFATRPQTPGGGPPRA